MLRVKGLNAWMKRILGIDFCKGFNFMLGNFLGKLSAEQRHQLFRIIISVDYGPSFLDQWFDKEIFGKEYDDNYASLKRILKCIAVNLDQSVIEELLVRNNYQLMKKALLINNGKKPIDVMLTFVSNNIKEEIIQNLVDLVPQLILEETVNYDQRKEAMNHCRIPNMLNFVFDNVDNCDLSKLVDLISNKYVYEDSPDRKCSIWSEYFKIDNKYNQAEKIDKFLKCVCNKHGSSAVEKLVVEHGDGKVITQVLTWYDTYDSGELVNALLRHLSKEKREKMKLKLVKDAPAKIKNLIDTDDTNPNEALTYWENILNLQFVVKYTDSDVLLELIQVITKSYPNGRTMASVWSEYLLNGDYDQELWSQNVDKFLQYVSEKLSKSKVKELVLHQTDCYGVLNSVISKVASYREESLVRVMLAHLTEEDREEIRRDHVDTAVETSDEEPLESDCSSDQELG